MARQIKQPQEEYKHFISRYFGPFGAVLSTNNGSSPASKLEAESAALLNQLEEKVKKRKDTLSNNLPGQTRRRIRLSETDLKTVLHHGSIMVTKFYSDHVLSKMTETEMKNFWYTKNIKAKDWLGLASFLFSDLFSPEFMIPLQAVDQTFALKVRI